MTEAALSVVEHAFGAPAARLAELIVEYDLQHVPADAEVVVSGCPQPAPFSRT